MSKILLVGDIMADLLTEGSITRPCPESDTANVFLEDTLEISPGGAGNVAILLADMGHKVTLCGQIGGDPAGQMLQSIFSKKIKFYPTILGITTQKHRFVQDGKIIIRTDREQIPIKWTLSLPNGQFDFVVVSDYAKGVVSGNLMRSLEKIPAKCRVANPKPSNMTLYRNFDLIQLNTSEFQTLNNDPYRVIPQNRALLVTADGTGATFYPGATSYPTEKLILTDMEKVGLGDKLLSYLVDCDLDIAKAQEQLSARMRSEARSS